MNLTDILQAATLASSAVIETYNAVSSMHPHLTTIGTAMGTFTAGDVLSQVVEQRSLPKDERKINWKRTAYTAKLSPLYGAGIDAIVHSTAIPEAMGIDSALGQTQGGPLLGSHLFNAGYFVNSSVGQKNDYSIGKLGEYYRNIAKRDGKTPETVREGITNIAHNVAEQVNGRAYAQAAAMVETFWLGFYQFNNSHVAPENRGPLALAVSVPWNAFVTYLSTRKSRSSE